jgi:AraC-like DNA-binding protein
VPRPLGSSPAGLRWEQLGFELSEENPIHTGVVIAHPTEHPEYDMHYGLELGVVIRGRMRRHYPDWQTDLEPGEVWLCGTWEPHGWNALSDPCEHLVFVLLPEVLLDSMPGGGREKDWLGMFAAAPERRPRVSGDERARTLAFVQRAMPHLEQRGSRRALWRRLLLLELLLLVESAGEGAAPPRIAGSRMHDVLQDGLAFVLSRRGLATAAETAQACAVSESTLRRAFKRFMGVSFAKHTLRLRLSQAATDLLRTRETIETIARRWGFTHGSHFHRWFAHYYRCSPRQYRERALTSAQPRVRGARGRARAR